MKNFFSKISWQKKLFIFATIISVIPILFVSNNIISIAKEELKSSTNSELISSANDLADQLNDFYKSLFENLQIIKNGLENRNLGQQEKLSFLLAGIKNVDNLISIKIVIEDNNHFVDAVEVRKDSLEDVVAANANFNDLFDFKKSEIEKAISESISLSRPHNIPDLQLWISEAFLELNMGFKAKTYLLAKINMSKIEKKLQDHPFNQSGTIVLIDKFNNTLFSPPVTTVDSSYLNNVADLLRTNKRISGLNNFTDESGKPYVTCIAFPENLDWAIISIIDETQAYIPVDDMIIILRYWLIIGLILTLLGVILFSNVISKPIIKMGHLAKKIASGDFEVKVDYNANDSIGMLGSSLESMGHSLKSSFDKIEKQNKELEDYSKTLEIKVEDRTKKLRKSNQDLQEAYMKVLELNKEKNEFLGIAAHDLKNPLITVKGYGEMILEDDELPRELLEDFVQAMVDSSNRMFTIIKSLLDVNAIEEGKIKLELEDVDVNMVLNNVIPTYVARAKDKNIELIKETNNSCYAFVDMNLLTQVVENIVSNAVKFSPPDKKIFAKVYSNDSTVYCSIKDQGPGFSEVDKKKLFGKFAKLSARPTGGEHSTGLGLSIVKKLVEMMDGDIYVISEQGEGAEFIIEFPLKTIDN